MATDPYARTVMSTPILGEGLGLSRQPVRPELVTPRSRLAGPCRTVQDRTKVAGRTVQVVTTANGHAIVVDGRVVASGTEDDRMLIQGVTKVAVGRTSCSRSSRAGQPVRPCITVSHRPERRGARCLTPDRELQRPAPRVRRWRRAEGVGARLQGRACQDLRVQRWPPERLNHHGDVEPCPVNALQAGPRCGRAPTPSPRARRPWPCGRSRKALPRGGPRRRASS